jgi:outer membrane protein assembly factor BamB
VITNRKFASLVVCLLVLSLAVVQGSSNRTKMGRTRSVSLPSYAILDENAQPLIASSGKVGFISSVTGGTLISFSVTSGKVISTLVVGETAGPISLVEVAGRRLVAVPALNDASSGVAPTVSIVDATSARRLDVKALLVLPSDAQITPATRAFITRDGRFCLIASSFAEPQLFSFDIETGQITSQLALVGRPSEIAFHDEGGKRRLAISSAVANNVSVIDVDEAGQLSLGSSFTPVGARLDEANNPAFSSDGRTLYIAASESNQLFAVNAETGAQTASLAITSPQRISVAKNGGAELLGVTRVRRPAANNNLGGVTIVNSENGHLASQAEFAPPEGIDFSRANNVVFDKAASIAFVASSTGVLFAFSTDTGELEAHQIIGSELRRIALSEKAQSVVAVRSTSGSDEVVIIGFDQGEPEEAEDTAPVIESLKPDVVDQGRRKNLRLMVKGANFSEGVSLLVDGNELAADLIKGGRTLEARLPQSLFEQSGNIRIEVKAANGAVSQPKSLRVMRPDAPLIEKIRPTEVAGPGADFTLKVFGNNFRPSSTIFVAGQRFNTEQLGDGKLQAQVPAEVVRSIGQIPVQIVDLAVEGLASNEVSLTVFGPRIKELKTSDEVVVAGAGKFGLRIIGDNFRDGAKVEINGTEVPAGRALRRSRNLIRLSVPGRLVQDAGRLAVVVRNPEGSASEPKEFEALAPEIKEFAPGEVIAGLADTKVDIRGQNFRRHARVYVRNTSDPEQRAFRVERNRLRFKSSTRIVVTLAGELNDLLKQPGQLKFQIVNPNGADGVPSVDKELNVVGPRIDVVTVQPVEGDDLHVKLVITGVNFRNGAMVELVKSGQTFGRQRAATKVGSDKVTAVVRAKKLAALGAGFQVYIVNPGEVRSNGREPESR